MVMESTLYYERKVGTHPATKLSMIIGTFKVRVNALCIMMWPGDYGIQAVKCSGLNEISA